MFINKLFIKNFRGFNQDGIEIDFNTGFTSILGRNGSGKTTIIEALNYLLGQEYLSTRVSEKDFHCDANKIEDEIIIECETANPFFIALDLISKEKYAFFKNVIVPCNKVRLSIKRRELTEKVLDEPFIINRYVIPILGTIDESIYNGVKGDYSCYEVKEDTDYLVKFKIKNGEARTSKILAFQLTYNPNKIQRLVKAYYLDKDRDKEISGSYSFINKVLTDLHWKYKKETNDDSSEISEQYKSLAINLRNTVDEKGILINAVNERVKEICLQDKKLSLHFLDIEQPYKDAFIASDEYDKCLLPNNLGSGFNILIAYALISYVAEKEKTPILLLIDEPELHLHVDWQKRLYDTFSKETRLQIVVSTQSENFVSLGNWRQIRVLKEGIVHPDISALTESISTTDGETGTREECLDDYSKKYLHISCILRENMELFFSKKVLLVEGASEKYALPKLLNLNGLDISKYSIAIIPVWGKSKLKIYQTICMCFGVNYFTMFDSDKLDEEEIANENQAIVNNSYNKQLIQYSTNFEKLLGVGSTGKFQQVVNTVDNLENLDKLNDEIKTSLSILQGFIED